MGKINLEREKVFKLSDYGKKNRSESEKGETKKSKEKKRLVSLLGHMEIQQQVMDAVKEQVETYMQGETFRSAYVFEPKSHYGEGGFMADYIMGDNGEVIDVRFDWVNHK